MRPSTDSEAIEQEAARWVVRRDSGTWTDAHQVQLDAWLGQHIAHRIAYVRLEAAWEQCARMRALGAGVPEGVIPPRASWGSHCFRRVPPETHPPPACADSSHKSETPGTATPSDVPRARARRLAGTRFLALAATVLAFAVGLYVLNAGLFAGTRYATPVGGIANLPLADGSRVTLNTDTSVRVAFTDRERRIRLERGEAFFEVAKDRTRPFVVYVGEKRVIAVGTKFSVRRDDDDIQVVVTEGRVNVAAAATSPPHERGGAGAWTQGGGRDASESTGTGLSSSPSTYLSAGAVARTSKAEVLVRPGATLEAEKLLSWRNGYVVFDDTALADAVAEFNRYNRRKIFIEDPSIAAIHIGGNFRSDNADAFLWLLQGGFPITVEQTEDRVVLKGR